MKNKILIIIVCILFVLSIVCTIYGYLNRNTKTNESNNTNIDTSINKDIDTNNSTKNVIVYNNDTETDTSIDENDSDYEDDIIRNGKIDDCTIDSIYGTKIELKNTVAKDGDILSDVYINGKFSKNISFYSSPYNTCESYEPVEIAGDYFLLSFFWEDIASLKPYNYLFNKNGKYITDFSSWKKKYEKEKGLENVYGDIVENADGVGGILIIYDADEGMEMSKDEAYCDLKAKPSDIYSIVERISIKNDKLKVESIDKRTWEEEFSGKNNIPVCSED